MASKTHKHGDNTNIHSRKSQQAWLAKFKQTHKHSGKQVYKGMTRKHKSQSEQTQAWQASKHKKHGEKHISVATKYMHGKQTQSSQLNITIHKHGKQTYT